MPENNDYWNASAAPVAPEAAAQPYAQAQAPQQPYAQAQAPQQPQPSAAQPAYNAYAQTPAPQPQLQPQAPKPKKSHGWKVAIVIIVCLFVLCALGIVSCSSALASLGPGMGSDEPSSNSVAVIELDGTIQYDGTACSPEGFKELLDKAADDERIVAVVLRVNSGGGTATAGEEMAEYLRRFKEDSKKPVVVSSASINASAAYEISAQADYIFVAKSTEIGAIGTAMELTDLSGLLDMLGVNMEVITSADSKDSSYGYRPLTEEERAYYQDMVDQINQMFIENVMAGRNMTEDQVKKLATGLAFTGTTAVDNGLADEVGTREDALDKAAELAGVSKGDYETYDLALSSYDFSGFSYLLGRSNASVDDLISALEGTKNAHNFK